MFSPLQMTATTQGGVCFPPTPPLPSPPTDVFPDYQEHFTAATQLCVVRMSGCILLCVRALFTKPYAHVCTALYIVYFPEKGSFSLLYTHTHTHTHTHTGWQCFVLSTVGQPVYSTTLQP